MSEADNLLLSAIGANRYTTRRAPSVTNVRKRRAGVTPRDRKRRKQNTPLRATIRKRNAAGRNGTALPKLLPRGRGVNRNNGYVAALFAAVSGNCRFGHRRIHNKRAVRLERSRRANAIAARRSQRAHRGKAGTGVEEIPRAVYRCARHPAADRDGDFSTPVGVRTRRGAALRSNRNSRGRAAERP